MAQARVLTKNFDSVLNMSLEERATAPQLELAFEALPRSGIVHEEIIMNTVGTSGVTSASYCWSRVASALGRLTH